MLRRSSIATKLTLIAMLTSAGSMLLGGPLFIVLESVDARRHVAEELQSQAQVTAANSASALMFNDPDSARQTMASLAADTDIEAAALYDRGGRVFASWTAGLSTEPPPLAADGLRFGPGRLEAFLPVVVAGDREGTLYLRSSLADVDEHIRHALGVAGLVILATLPIVFLLARGLQGIVADPIAQLARVSSLAAGGNLAVRAVRKSDDELGRLVDAFNHMLDQIRTRDTELQLARERLEQRVAERTLELEHKAAELAASRDRLVLATAAGGVGLWNWEIASDRLRWDVLTRTILGHPDDGNDVTLQTFIQRVHPDDLPLIQSDLQTVLPNPAMGNYHRRLRIVRPDGDSRVTELDARIERDAQGRPLRALGVVSDITERVRAQAELDQAQRELAATARASGMAEIASNVLHNVGNALNSVNISAGLLQARLGRGTGPRLDRIAGLLQEHAADLPGFFAGERGRLVPDYLSNLAAQAHADQQQIDAELANLTRNIDHIKEVVAMQQSYARVGTVDETIDVNAVIEDCLAMNAESLVKHGVAVERQLAPLPPLRGDKHKLLLILMNLVGNAKHACAESGRSDCRMLVLSTAVDGGLRIEVIDNGVGIAPANMARLFSHGFTTRAAGHGFGLHASALAAAALGGRLHARSDGPGRGATFTLELSCGQGAPPAGAAGRGPAASPESAHG